MINSEENPEEMETTSNSTTSLESKPTQEKPEDPDDQEVVIFHGKASDGKKEGYKATFTFHPDKPGPSWADSFDSKRRKFENDCSSIQTKSREELARRRIIKRNAKKAKIREESMEDLSVKEMFNIITDKMDSRSDTIEEKLTQCEI